MKRYLWLALFKTLPFTRRWLWQPSIEVAEPGRYRYPCWDCNDPQRGYSPWTTRRVHRWAGQDFKAHRGLCKRCYTRRSWWHWRTWLLTGETVHVPEVQGEGWSRPSTTNASYDFPVIRIMGQEYVSATAARLAQANADAARFWFEQFGVEGNTQHTEHMLRLARREVIVLPLEKPEEERHD